MTAPLIEICTDGPEGCVAAEQGGADRIELCSALPLGGLTPGPGTLELARRATGLPIMAMARPRAGDFCYTAAELDVLAADIAAAGEAGMDGVVLGVLRPDGTVDAEAVARLVEVARPMQVVFHRALDVSRDPLEALDVLLDLGVDRVLSSGAMPSVPEGLETLAAMVARAGERLTVMPGGGVREHNIAEVLAATGAREVHVTAGVLGDSPMVHRRPDIPMASADPPGEYDRKPTTVERVAALVAAARG